MRRCGKCGVRIELDKSGAWLRADYKTDDCSTPKPGTDGRGWKNRVFSGSHAPGR